jgi:hypothetical protein
MSRRGVGIVGFTVLLAGFAAVVIWTSAYPEPAFEVGDRVTGVDGQAGVVMARVKFIDGAGSGMRRSWRYVVVYDTGRGQLRQEIPESWLVEPLTVMGRSSHPQPSSQQTPPQ